MQKMQFVLSESHLLSLYSIPTPLKQASANKSVSQVTTGLICYNVTMGGPQSFICSTIGLCKRLLLASDQIGLELWPEVIQPFSCSTQLSTKFHLLIKTKTPTNKEVSCFKSRRCSIHHANKC